MKHCKYCGKELHDNASFCPYCMRKVITTESVEIPKRKHAYVIYFLITFLFIIAILVFLLVLNGKTEKPVSQSEESNESMSNPTEYSTEEITEDTTSSTDLQSEETEKVIDYASYIGMWYNKDNPTQEEMIANGGTSVQIFSIDDSIAEISVTSINSGARNIATTDMIYGKVERNTIDFRFQNDGWMNSGYGSLTLLDDSIFVEIVYNYTDPNSMWHLYGGELLYQVSSDPMDVSE